MEPNPAVTVPKARNAWPDGTRGTLTVPEAAAVLGVSRAHAYESVRRGDLPVIRLGGAIRVSRQVLERILDQGHL